MTEDLIQRYAKPLPRYTSYPTANHFGPVSSAQYRAWLAALPETATLSLYAHIPFCEQLCWYCGCSTKAVRRYEPVAHYLDVLLREIEVLGPLVPKKHRVTHMHWGGGSPDILKAEHIVRLGTALRESFHFDPHAEVAAEIDPRLLTTDQADAFARIGINRISIGVQDFDPKVQDAIGRTQTYETTSKVVGYFRDRGVGSINVDLVYGLPHQTVESVTRTLDQVLTLKPDRIAIFGYAHLPSRLKHQRLIDESALPGPMQRFEQARTLSNLLVKAGYAQLGLDHFARQDDTLATKSLQRNFQGYTTDTADALLGLGATAISRLPQGYAQNAVPVDEYERRVGADGLATARGHAMRGDDDARAFAIERLMCEFSLSFADLKRRFGKQADALVADAQAVCAQDEDGFIERTSDGFRLTAKGKPFVRNICADLDAYLTHDIAQRRHALSV